MLSKQEANNFIEEFKFKHPALHNTKIGTVMHKESFGENYANMDKFQGAYLPKDNIMVIVISEHKSLQDLETTLKHETYGHHALYRINHEQKRDLLHSIRELKHDINIKPYWEMVNREYPKMDLNQKAEEVFAAIVEKSQIGYKMVKEPNYHVKSIDDIKNISYNLQNKYLKKELEQQIKPKSNLKQFKKAEYNQVKSHSPETLKEFLKQSRAEHHQVRSIAKDNKGMER